MTEDEMVGWHDQLNGHEFEQTLGAGDGQGGLACCSPWDQKELETSQQLNNKKQLNVSFYHECELNISKCFLISQDENDFLFPVVGGGFSHQLVTDSCDPMDCSPPGSSVHGILQARTLEWVAISFFRGSSRLGD